MDRLRIPGLAAVGARPQPGSTPLRSLFQGTARTHRPGTVLFSPGEPARNLLLLESGLVKLTDLSFSGDEAILRLYQPGDIFGETCFLQGVRQYFATAIESSVVRELSAREVVEQVRNRPEALLELLGVLSRRLVLTDGELQTVVSDSVVVRLASRLLAFVASSDAESEWLEVPHGFRHQELAQMIGVQRETVTRAMGSLKRLGLVATAARRPLRVHRAGMRRFLGETSRIAHQR